MIRKENRMCITTKVECRLGKFAKRNMHHTLFVLLSVCLSVLFCFPQQLQQHIHDCNNSRRNNQLPVSKFSWESDIVSMLTISLICK